MDDKKKSKKIHDSKTEFIIFRSPRLKQNLSDLSISVGDTQLCPSSKVRDLGVVFDQYLTFHDHIRDTSPPHSLQPCPVHELYLLDVHFVAVDISMQKLDKRLSLTVDLNHVFALCSVLKDLSTVHDVSVRVSTKRIVLRTAESRVDCFTSPIIPRELSSSGLCFCTSYNARPSSTRWLSMLHISLTDETICLN